MAHTSHRPIMVLALLLPACMNEPEPEPTVSHRAQSLTLHCSVNVKGYGVKAVETDYIPNVVNCENGDADTEALKALAVAARTYLHYKLGDTGTTITSGTSVQVYGCPRANLLAQPHFDAAKDTEGLIMMYGSTVIWPCYNAGTKPSPPACLPTPGIGADVCVTNNDGKSGSDINPSLCGHPDNPKNRGCMSQNGSHCMSLSGKSYIDILRFYYGADIQLVKVPGSCGGTAADAGPGADSQAPGSADSTTAAADLHAAADLQSGTPEPDARIPGVDKPATAPGSVDEPRATGRDGSAGNTAAPAAGQLMGGCQLAGGTPRAGAVGLWLLLLGGWLRRRRAS